LPHRRGDLKRTKIRGWLRVPVWEIERYKKELEREMESLCRTGN